MKKSILIVLLISLMICTFLCGVGGQAVAESDSPYEIAVKFTALHARRDIESGGEKASAETLKTYLTEKGYAVETLSFREYVESDTSSVKASYEYLHVIGRKDNGKEKTILIGCYYGGFTPTDSSGVGQGASAALSVGTVLYVADRLATASCPYNIAIAFWGGIELGGSFDATKCGVPLEEIALYINLDDVAAGDRDYVYSDDVPRAQQDYFLGVISDCGADITDAPAYKKESSLSFSSDEHYSFTHLGLLGANRFFLNEGVPCINFVGGAWEHDCGLYRYKGKGEIEGTSLDTIEELDRLNGGKDATANRLSAVAEVVIRGVTDEGVTAVLEEAGGQVSGAALDSSLAYYLITFIGLGLVFAFLLILYIKQGKDRKEVIWDAAFDANQSNDDPFDEFREDGGDRGDPSDPYGGNEPFDPPSGSEGDDDDIFRF